MFALILGAIIPALAGTRSVQAAPPVRVYVFAGQSNMVGDATVSGELRAIEPTLSLPSDDVEFWGPTSDLPYRWAPLQAPTEIEQPLSHQGFGPEISAAARLVRRHQHSTIAIVKLAQNGTSLYHGWKPDRPYGLYGRMIVRVQLAMDQLRATGRTPRLAGFFWMQGESDGSKWDHATAYGENLQAFITAVRRDLRAPRLPFVFGQIQDLRNDSPLLGRYGWIVRREQAEVARTVRDTYMVSTDGLERSPLSPIHFSTRGTVDLGRRFTRGSIPL